MAKYYGSFMQKQAFKDRYAVFDVIAIAENAPGYKSEAALAREAMFAHFGDQFFTVYDEEAWAKSMETPYMPEMHALCHIQVIHYGHDSIEYKLLQNDSQESH